MPPTPRLAVLTPADLEKIGRALYGEQWQTPLSRDLGMSDRSLRYLADGTRPIHAELAAELLALLRARRDELDELAEKMASKAASSLATQAAGGLVGAKLSGSDAAALARMKGYGDGFQRQVTTAPRIPKPRR